MAIVPSLPFNLQNGQLADASQVMANFNDILNGVNANAAANGANNDITALLALSTPIGPTAGGAHDYYGGTVTGTANAIVVATTVLPSAGFTLTAGKTIWFLATATNTGAVTFNGVGSGATAVLKQSPSGLIALSGGEIVSGQLVGLTFDGTQYELLNNPLKNIGAQTSLASAATTDLGTVPTHNVLITGTTTITAFGSTAVTALPFYLIGFNGALTLTHNGASLILPGAANILTAAGDFALAMYLGAGNWRILSYSAATGIPVSLTLAGGFRALKVLVASASTVTTTADAISLENASGYAFRALAVNVTADITVSGANGLDTGAEAASTWYNKWVIYNPATQTVAALLSLSATAPTMPAGYTHKARVGAVRNDVGSNLLRTVQYGRTANIIFGTLPAAPSAVSTLMITGVQGNVATPTFVAVAVGAFVPPTAYAIRVKLQAWGNNIAFVAPNNTAAWSSDLAQDGPYVAVPHNVAGTAAQDIVLETTNIYYTGNTATTNLVAIGWTDNL